MIILHSTLSRNILSLYIIHFANYLIPLILIPYLVRVLGPSSFGMVSFSQSLIAYINLFVDYGFALSATRKISIYRDNKEEINKIFANVLFAKILLGLIGFIALLFLIFTIPKLKEVSDLLIILYGTIIGSILFPIWFYQGMEKMFYISVVNLLAKLFMLVGIFAFVRSPDHYSLYAGIYSLSSIVAGFYGIIFAVVRFKIKFTTPSLAGVWKELKDGWMLFLSMASVSLYTIGNPFILGLLTNNTVVGYYSAAERIVLALSGLLGPITQAIYPRFNKMAAESKILALQWGKKALFLIGGIGLVLSLIVILLAPIITNIILGSKYHSSIIVMQILAPWIFINAVTNVWGIQIMLSFNYDKPFFFILLIAGLINIAFALLMVPSWGERGMAISVLLSCIFVTIAQPTVLYFKGINVFTGRLRYDQRI